MTDSIPHASDQQSSMVEVMRPFALLSVAMINRAANDISNGELKDSWQDWLFRKDAEHHPLSFENCCHTIQEVVAGYGYGDIDVEWIRNLIIHQPEIASKAIGQIRSIIKFGEPGHHFFHESRKI